MGERVETLAILVRLLTSQRAAIESLDVDATLQAGAEIEVVMASLRHRLDPPFSPRETALMDIVQRLNRTNARALAETRQPLIELAELAAAADLAVVLDHRA